MHLIVILHCLFTIRFLKLHFYEYKCFFFCDIDGTPCLKWNKTKFKYCEVSDFNISLQIDIVSIDGQCDQIISQI